MAECDIKKPIGGDADKVLAAAKERAAEEKAVFEGDAKRGRFVAQSPVGEVEGTYTVQGSTLEISVTSKPWLASCQAIEEKFDAFLKCPTCAAKR